MAVVNPVRYTRHSHSNLSPQSSLSSTSPIISLRVRVRIRVGVGVRVGGWEPRVEIMIMTRVSLLAVLVS